MIKVLVSGALGRMGSEICKTVDAADDLELVAGVDPMAKEGATVGKDGAPVFTELAGAIDAAQPEVMIDFTRPDAAEGNLRCALGKGVNCVLGTTGLSEEKLQQIFDESATGDAALFHAPNFTTGAVLMMLFAQQAAKYFPDAEVIELHHDGKRDAPSGTAIRTARMIAANKGEESTAPGKETELEGYEGARGADVAGVPVHSVRTAGFVAHQEVIFGSMGQTLTIRHDSIDRASYMPGILMAVRAIDGLSGVTVGLENLMD
ncbi:MAG: 4-hydroxy-tetrahydrodipicolinate reductase [Coriobacteriales bacterium]|jgi:4-hydroxy-tetrahydrodipicolinate reductase